MAMPSTLSELYQCLLTQYGRQGWWPADSPFEIMVGAILTQNTNWLNVEKALANLKQKISLDADSILSLAQEELEACLKPSGYFRIKTQRLQFYCRWYLLQGGYHALQQLSTQRLRKLLLDVHGVGPETADDILLYAFERPVFVIDAYTRRLLVHLQMIKGSEGYEALRSLFEENLPKRVDLYKQFHALIVVHAKQCGAGAKINKPVCEMCQLTKLNAYSASS
ncbi:endonuclease III domain-containing protein [Rickettsiella endosymbiont of Dermanyssus gallinae]|uniref:endonuclease III domain-containing protein n=1 Tax=Rickettsiella endosymbiont of Dermanyssus gallinae TaxID=2856608 RepID=UPI001FE51563|nr:endonuclease [Rickettsiella endosymbiont of Dermanyssus gallinae]